MKVGVEVQAEVGEGGGGKHNKGIGGGLMCGKGRRAPCAGRLG